MKEAVDEYGRNKELPRWNDKYKGEDWARIHVEIDGNGACNSVPNMATQEVAEQDTSNNEHAEQDNTAHGSTIAGTTINEGNAHVEEQLLDEYSNYEWDHMEY
ncbi:hypothetical protein ACA910_010863 [Epithemia clementina (nom. ined.)]